MASPRARRSGPATTAVSAPVPPSTPAGSAVHVATGVLGFELSAETAIRDGEDEAFCIGMYLTEHEASGSRVTLETYFDRRATTPRDECKGSFIMYPKYLRALAATAVALAEEHERHVRQGLVVGLSDRAKARGAR